MSTVIPFFRPASARQGNWSQQELAEFYRVEAALLRAGFSIASEHGLSDEGEPWFVFCRPDGDAIIHFAKIDGSYLIASEALDRPVRGTDFRTLIDQIARLHPHLLPIPAAGTATTLVVHPAALLAALVAAAALILSSEDAHAGPLVAGGEGLSTPSASQGGGPAQGQPQSKGGGGSGDRAADRKQMEAIILSAMIFAAEAMAVDHRAVSAELNLDFADGTGNALSPIAQGDAAQTSGTAFGSLRGGAAAQPAVLTAQGSGTNPDARPQPASDTIPTASRADSAPVARTEFGGEAPKSPASQNQPLAPGFGGDVLLTGASVEASAAKSSTQQTATSGRSESAAPASDVPGTDSSDQRAGSVSTAEPPSHARPGQTLSSDAGSGPAHPAWVHDMIQAVTSRVTSTEASSRDAEDRGHGRPAESALGNGPKVDAAGPGNGRVDGAGRDRESSAKTAAETHQTGDQAAPGHSKAGGAQGRGGPAETATGSTPPAEQARPGQGSVDRADQDRGAPSTTAAGRSPNAEQAAPHSSQSSARGQDRAASGEASHETRAEQTGPVNGQVNTVGPDQASSPEGASGHRPQTAPAGGGNGRPSGVDRDEAAPTQAEAAHGPSVEPSNHGSGNAGTFAQERGPQAEATTGSKPSIEQTGRGNDHASVVARQEAATAQTEDGNPSPAAQTGHGSRNADVVAQERPPQAQDAVGNNPRSVQSGPSEGRADASGPGSAQAEATIGERPEAQQAGHASGQEKAHDQGSSRQAGAVPGNDPQIEPTSAKNGQGQGSHGQPEPVAPREPGSSGPALGHDRSSSNANERGSTAQAEAARPETEQSADHGNGPSSASASASAERNDQRVPEAHGPGATDTVSSHGRPDTPGEARSDAPSTTKVHPALDSVSAAHGSNKLSATERPDGGREPTERAAPEHAAVAEQTPAAADGPAQNLTSSPSEHGRGNAIGQSADHASNAGASEPTNGEVSGTKDHGSAPSAAGASSSNDHVGGAGPQASHAQDDPGSHGHNAAAEAAIPASVARDPILQDRGSDRALAENSVGHGASPGSDALNASAKGAHAQAEPDGPHDGAGSVAARAIPAADPPATVHGVDENGQSVSSAGPHPMLPSAPVSQDEIATAHPVRARADDGPSVGGRAEREAPGQATQPVRADPPTEPAVHPEADLADGPSPTSPSSSAASHGTSGQAKPGRPSPPPAAIDAEGNLVFHTAAHQDPVPSALPQGPDEATPHHAVGLIGVSDQAHPMHDLYHHT